MTRVEIIANHSVEENILEALARENAGKHYTKYHGVLGVGSAGPRMGDAIWPEENFALVIWCGEEEVIAIKRAIAKVKEIFPGEGIKMFTLSASAGTESPPVPSDKPEPPPPIHLGPVGENI